MSTATLERPVSLDTDHGGFCHFIDSDTGATFCGGPIAPDSPGRHPIGLELGDVCSGCGRPVCIDCLLIFDDRIGDL